MQQQSHKQVPLFKERLQVAIQITKMFAKAGGQDADAAQMEDLFVKSFEQLHIAEPTIQAFKERLEKIRLSSPHAYHEDTYAMGGILVFCSILLPALLGLGIPDFPSRLAWIAFATAFPCAVGFFLARFLKERNSISRYGRIHSLLALLAEIGILTTTTSLLFHVWNVAGWIFLCWSLAVFLGYYVYRFSLYFKPMLDIIRLILKTLSESTPQKEESGEAH